MKIKMKPTINISALEDELKLQFDIDVEGELSTILFYDDYMNDCYKSYYFADDYEYTGQPWEKEERIRVTNCVNAILRDLLPGEDRILIDVSW